MKNNERTAPQTTGTFALKLRWEQAEASLQRAWDADNRRSTERTQVRVQRAWDKAQITRHAYDRAVRAVGGAGLDDGYADGYEPTE